MPTNRFLAATRPHRPLALALGLAAVIAACQSPTQAQFWNLGSGFVPTDASADGEVVVGIRQQSLTAFPELVVPDGFITPSVKGQYFDWVRPSENGGGVIGILGVAPGNSLGGIPRITDDASRVSGIMFNYNNLTPMPESYDINGSPQLVPVVEMSYLDRATNVWTNLGFGEQTGSVLYKNSTGYAMSADGSRILGHAYIDGVDRFSVQGIQWTDDGSGQPTPESFHVFEGDAGSARSISNDGSVVVGMVNQQDAAMWVDGELAVVLEVGDGLGTGTPLVSGNGNWMIGSDWWSGPGDYNAERDGTVNLADYTVWRDNLGSAPGTLSNDTDGGVIGQAQYDTWKANQGPTGNPGEAWRWSAETGMESLGCLFDDCSGDRFGPQKIGVAIDANFDGSMILGADGSDPWIWREGIGMTSLRDFFAAEGFVFDSDSDNFEYTQPLGMSADGRTFYGTGFDSDSPSEFPPIEGWIVTLPPLAAAVQSAPVPEPSTVAMLLAALALGWGRPSKWRCR